MALTIEQIQTNITNKSDAREIINQIADYIEANPSGSSGGSGYLVYNARLSGGISEAPTELRYDNTIGATAWVRSGEGAYNCPTTTDWEPDKITIPGYMVRADEDDVTTGMVAYYDFTGTTIQGYFKYGAGNEGNGKITLLLEHSNVDGDPIDLGAIDVPDKLNLPELRVYPTPILIEP